MGFETYYGSIGAYFTYNLNYFPMGFETKKWINGVCVCEIDLNYFPMGFET